MKVRFVIPVRHPEGVADRPAQLAALRQTIASVAGQSSPDWTATIVANPAQVLPSLPAGVRVVHVDLPPNTALAAARSRPEVIAAIQLDKGRRVAAGVADVAPDDLIMVVDDDDLVHRDLVAFVRAEPPGCGWVIDKGYWWRPGSGMVKRKDRFHARCGTSLLVPPRYYAHFSGGLSETDAIREIGSHKRIFDRLPYETPAWRSVPFLAAIYRLQGGLSRTQMAGAAADGVRLQRVGLRRQLKELPTMRLLTPGLRRDFFGAPVRT